MGKFQVSFYETQELEREYNKNMGVCDLSSDRIGVSETGR